MVTIRLKIPDELANRLRPYEDRLPETIELGLRQMEGEAENSAGAENAVRTKEAVLAALEVCVTFLITARASTDALRAHRINGYGNGWIPSVHPFIRCGRRPSVNAPATIPTRIIHRANPPLPVRLAPVENSMLDARSGQPLPTAALPRHQAQLFAGLPRAGRARARLPLR